MCCDRADIGYVIWWLLAWFDRRKHLFRSRFCKSGVMREEYAFRRITDTLQRLEECPWAEHATAQVQRATAWRRGFSEHNWRKDAPAQAGTRPREDQRRARAERRHDRAMFRRKLFDADVRPRVAMRARVLLPAALFGFISENLSLHAFHIFCY